MFAVGTKRIAEVTSNLQAKCSSNRFKTWLQRVYGCSVVQWLACLFVNRERGRWFKSPPGQKFGLRFLLNLVTLYTHDCLWNLFNGPLFFFFVFVIFFSSSPPSSSSPSSFSYSSSSSSSFSSSHLLLDLLRLQASPSSS